MSIGTIESQFRTLSETLETKYINNVVDTVAETGTPTMQRIKPSAMVATQRDNILRFITARADNARLGKDMMRDFGEPNFMESASLNYRYNPQDASANDFRGIDAVGRVGLHEIRTASAAGILDVAKNVAQDFYRGLDETPSTMLHSDAAGQVGLVNGTPVALTNDFANGSSYSSGSTSATFAIDGFSIGIYREGMVIDIYTSAGVLIRSNLKIRHIDWDQQAISVEVTSNSNVQNCDSIANNHVIYRSGEKDQGFLTSFGEIFKETISSGDSWVGGVDRSTIENMYLIPQMFRRNASTTVVAGQSQLDQAAEALAYQAGKDRTKPMTAIAGNKLITTIRNSIANHSISMNSSTSNATHKFGNTGVSYVHPELNEIELVGDHTARNDRLIMLDTSDIEIFYGAMRGVEILTRNQGFGLFERMEGTNSVRGGSKIFKVEGTSWMTPIVHGMHRMVCIHNLETDI